MGFLSPLPLAFVLTGRALSDDFLKDTIATWQPLSAEPLTMADAQEIAASMTDFFSVLARCAKEAGTQLNKPAQKSHDH